jgi:hypothetical protein
MRIATCVAVAASVFAGSAHAAKPARVAPAMVPAGEPVNCVQTTQIRSTRVMDDQTIDFQMRNGKLLRNTLPHQCPGLGFAQAFSYRTSISQLCNVDIISVVQQGGGPVRGASCGLGQFAPVKPAPADASPTS